MKYIYIILCIPILIDVFKKSFGILSIAQLSFVFYTMSCLSGNVWIEGGRTGMYYLSEIDNKTYLLVCLQLLLICFVPKIKIVKRDKLNNMPVGKINQTDKYCLNLIAYISLVLFFYNVFFQIGIDVLFSTMHKSDVLSLTNSLFAYSIWGVLITFAYSLQYKRKILLILSLTAIFVVLIMGSRAYPAVALFIFIISKNKEVKNIVNENRKLLIILVLASLLFIIYKDVYKHIRALDLTNAVEALIDFKLNEEVVNNVESRITFSLYDYVVRNDYRISYQDTIARQLSIIPLMNNWITGVLPIRFSEIAKTILIKSSYGLGGSFWAESFTMFGSAGVLIITSVWIYIIKTRDKLVRCNNKFYCFYSVAFVYLSFYIHRLDWIQVYGAIKSVMLWFIIFLFSKIIISNIVK